MLKDLWREIGSLIALDVSGVINDSRMLNLINIWVLMKKLAIAFSTVIFINKRIKETIITNIFCIC